MKNTGASYLLLSEEQMKRISTSANAGRGIDRRRLNRPHHASLYASLSPIFFPSPKELCEKMQSYIQKKSKPGKGPLRDTSRANKTFDREYPARSSFEHQRYVLIEDTKILFLMILEYSGELYKVQLILISFSYQSCTG